MCEVMRAPFWPSGSLAIWTMISCPSLQQVADGRRGGLLRRVAARRRGRVRGSERVPGGGCSARASRALVRRPAARAGLVAAAVAAFPALAPHAPRDAVQIARPLLAQGGGQAGGDARRFGPFFLDDGSPVPAAASTGSGLSASAGRLDRRPPRILGSSAGGSAFGRPSAIVSARLGFEAGSAGGLHGFRRLRPAIRFLGRFGSVRLSAATSAAAPADGSAGSAAVSPAGFSSVGLERAGDGRFAGCRFRLSSRLRPVCLARDSPGSTRKSSSCGRGRLGPAGAGSEGRVRGFGPARLAGAGVPRP